MEFIKKAHPYFDHAFLLHYIIGVLCLFCYLFFRIEVMLRIGLYTFIMIGLFHVMSYYKNKKELMYLISNVDAIIDQRPLDIIDGEGEISLLSHKIFILNKRYHSLIEAFKQEQIALKDYIEDISHQLKTPITSMRLNEELLLEVIQDQKQKEKLEHIYQQTLKMNQLVNDLLTLALLDSQSIEFHYEHYPIELLIENVEEDLQYLMIQNHMNIQLHHHNESLLCDEKWMSEALKNVIKNCIEKNKDGVVDINIEDYDTFILLQIQDHGNGFLEEDIPHLFERFYRGKNKDYQGVGIGLSLSKAIIEQHHGFIKVMNKNGAFIEITIPKLLAKKKV